MTEPTLPALDTALHGRTRQAPLRWPADRTLLHVAQDDDGLADLQAADPGPDAPLIERLQALLDAGADRREAALVIGVSRQRLSQLQPVRGRR